MSSSILRSSLQKKIREKLWSLVEERVVPGIQIVIGIKDQCLFEGAVGTKDDWQGRRVGSDTLFDLASLTKIISTVSLWLDVAQKNEISFEEKKLKHFFPSLRSHLKEVSLQDLLQHRAALPPLFRDTVDLATREQRILHFLTKVDDQVLEAPQIQSPEVVYSDVGFILLGSALERLHGKRLRDFFPNQEELFYGSTEETRFKWKSFLWGDSYNGCLSLDPPPRLLRGIPQDPRAQWLMGDAGHAGLFGTARAVDAWAKEWYRCYHGKGLRWSDALLRKCVDFKSFDPKQRFIFGFDTPDRVGPSQAGKFFPATSIGHLGFTGSSFWMDTETGARITLLTHRFSKDNDPEQWKNHRPKLHDWIWQEVWGS